MKANIPFLVLAALMTIGAFVLAALKILPWEACVAFILGSALPVLQKGQEAPK